MTIAIVGCAVHELGSRHTQVRACSVDIQEPEAPPVLLSSGTISVSHSDLSTVLASHDALIEKGRRFPSVVTTFLTEADSDDSDQNCPEVASRHRRQIGQCG